MTKKTKKNYRKEKIEHVLNSAIEVFSEKGYDGARIEEIAKRAKVSKWNLYYFAGDKETIYQNALKLLEIKGYEYIKINVRADLSPIENMKKLIRGISKIANMPHIHAIVLTEMLRGGKYLPDSILKATANLIKTCKQILKKGVEEGLFIEINPLVVYMNIFGTFIMYNIVVPYIYNTGAHRQLIKKTGMAINEGVIKMVEEMILSYILQDKGNSNDSKS